LRDGGLLVWLWVPGTHLIGLFHFWDASRGDVGVHSIWQDIFSLPTPRIGYDSGLADFDFTEIHLQDVILDSGDGSSRHYNLGFQEWRMQSRHEGQIFMIKVKGGSNTLYSSWDLEKDRILFTVCVEGKTGVRTINISPKQGRFSVGYGVTKRDKSIVLSAAKFFIVCRSE
jgi:hypothetical protein